MALIRTQTFVLTRQRLSVALRLIPQQPDILSNAKKLREARVQFICGTNVRPSIRGWLVAAGIVKNNGRNYHLTDFGKRLADNDNKMANAGSWWCFHLNICFSSRSEPYRSLFEVLGLRADWVNYDLLIRKVAEMVTVRSGSEFAEASIEKDLDGVIKMFYGEGPLTDLGLIETRKEAGKLTVRISNPTVADETIIYALALARHRHFPSATTIHFSELIDIGFNHFLCMSVNTLRKQLRALSRGHEWQDYVKFVEGKDLDSIDFRDKLHSKMTVLRLLQETEDTWV